MLVALVPPATARASEGPPWGVRAALVGHYSTLVAADGHLYATRGLPKAEVVVRIDPRSGGTLAHSAELPGAGPLAFAGGAIWVAGLAASTGPRAEDEILVKLNATTLRREKVIVIGNDYKPGNEYKPYVFSGSSGRLWLATGPAATTNCTLRRLSPATGRALRSIELRNKGPQAGGCAAMSFDQADSALFVTTGGYNTSAANLFRLDPDSLKVLATKALPEGLNYNSMVAVGSRVWLTIGAPGANGQMLFLESSDLRLIAESQGMGVGGRGVAEDLPTFSQWPDVSAAGGRVWIASDGTLACFSPSSRLTLAMYTQLHRKVVATAEFAEVEGKLWAIGQNSSGTQSDVVLVGPPEACFS